MEHSDEGARVLGELRDIREDLNEEIEKELKNRGLIEHVWGSDRVEVLQKARNIVNEHIETVKG